MLTLFVLAPLALLPSAPRAQEKPAAAAQADTVAGKQLAALIARFNKQQNDMYEAYEKAATQAEKDAIYAKRPGKEYIPEFRAVAEAAKGTDTAVQAWLWVMRLTQNDPKETQRISALLLSEHMSSMALGELVAYTRDREVLRALVAESPHDLVRARALTALGQNLLESKSATEKAEGRDCLEAVMAEYAELPSGTSTFGKLAERSLYELDHLQIGMVAPDFEAVDENGVNWKLSDYRGKVVVVDFWGFW